MRISKPNPNHQLSPVQASLLLTLFFISLANWPFWSHFLEGTKSSTSNPLLFQISFFLFIFILTFNTIYLFVWEKIFRYLAILILLSSSLALYFMTAYGIVIDKSMIQNAIETDPAESFDLLNFNLLKYFFLYGIIPSLVILKLSIKSNSYFIEIKNRLRSILISAFVIILLILPCSKDYLSLSRNHRELRHLFNPSNYLYSTIILATKSLKNHSKTLTLVGSDARQSHTATTGRKKVLVLVIGETARFQNFTINGYARNTSPELSKKDIISYSNVSSCGTSTAVSLPCIFNHLGRENGGGEQSTKNYENLLDVLQKAGIKTIWKENNSGCKGICDRSENDPVPTTGTEILCSKGKCQDEVLLENLGERITNLDKDTVIVLHTQGSHGPAYFKRYPEKFKKFLPTCDTSDIQECDKDSIVNTYDNTILYTDYVISETINLLESVSSTHDTAMIYVSDHGESLGESGLYLHGSPYSIAPETQTHIPMFVWLSKQLQTEIGIDKTCLEKNKDNELSHDNIYHTVLGLFGVETSIYKSELNFLSQEKCN